METMETSKAEEQCGITTICHIEASMTILMFLAAKEQGPCKERVDEPPVEDEEA